ncbi:divergent polysaccharide deacetylase family protein [Pseudomonas syringae]|uniref:divergent polysaccharide deacetylase family protein n=1 Tax=Pseudomonas syringae TaxID=317 RepID=UPI00107289F5|nr:divergent polysaccharide deacetylase family protein [Pseudomonas syringae]
MTTLSAKTLNLIPGKLTLAQLRDIYLQPVSLTLDSSADQQIDDSVACVERILAENRTAYGINTGFGLLASTRIASEDLENLQRSLVLSHAAGVGQPISDELVRLIMVLKVNSLSRGFSGIRRVVIDALISLINAQVYPHIPLKGSVGASGDLAPLAHMSLVLLGEGKARYKGEWLNGVDALAAAGLQPLTLAAKEGLALLNGTQVSSAYALRGLFEGEDLFAAALTCGSLTVEAVLGSRSPFDARIHAARGQRGQIDAAACYRDLLGESSGVSESHRNCDKVQDPYSLRCQPQVMGACLTQLRQAAEVLEIEANAVSDNPLVFAAENDVISGGNFHAEPVAMTWLMAELQRRHLFFVDSRTSAKTVAAAEAQRIGLASVSRDVFLDDERTAEAITHQLQTAIKIARKYGSAVVIGHPYPVTLDVLERELPNLKAQGVEWIDLRSMISERGNQASAAHGKNGIYR